MVAVSIDPSVMINCIDFCGPRLLGVDVQRALKVHPRFCEAAKMMLGMTQHPLGHSGRTWIWRLVRRFGAPLRAVESVIIEGRPDFPAPKRQVADELAWDIVKAFGQL